MNIWLINPYGPIPTEDWREYRFAMMGRVLAENGHNVVWWTSNFSHHFKEFRTDIGSEIEVNSKFRVKLIPTTGYKKNIGLGRIFRDWVFAYRMYMKGAETTGPDLILYAESPLCLGFAGPALAKYHNCALVYDQGDLWPELMVQSAPKFIRAILEFSLKPVYFIRRKVFKNLDGILALAQPYFDAALEVESSLKSKAQEIIYNGIDVADFRNKMEKEGALNMDWLSIKDTVKVIFAGSLGPSYDIQTIIMLAKIIDQKKLKITILIAGDGPLRHAVEEAARQYSCIQYFGKLSPADLCTLYTGCDIGLAAYGPYSNVEMPDKFYDYTAAGLGIICSLKGEVLRKISQLNLGSAYLAGNSYSLLDAIITLTDNPETLSRIKQNSFDCANEFSSVSQTAKLEPFIQQALVHSQFKNRAKNV